MTTGVLLIGHGSRDATANVEFEALVERLRPTWSEFHVAHAYVELAEPSVDSGLAELAARCTRVVVVPVFLFAAGHVKNDIPLALERARRDFPDVQFTTSRALGVHPELANLAYERVIAALQDEPPTARTGLVVVGRGSSDPDANGDFCKFVRLLSEGRAFGWVQPCFMGISRPQFDETLEFVARSRPEQIVVLPYFLFQGRLLSRLSTSVEAFRARYPWIRIHVAGHLGIDDRLIALLHERVQDGLGGARPLPCDTCQYRTPISGVSRHVGGLEALLWSVRHSVTHTQAMPHTHAHRPLRKHVLVCTNADCATRGSLPLLNNLRRLVKEAGRELDIRVTRTLCMGRCGEGPTVAVYPDGVWYRGVVEGDAPELVQEHLLGDRLVSRLVDSIMQ